MPDSRMSRFELSVPLDREQLIGDRDTDIFLIDGESRKKSIGCTAADFTLSGIGIPILKEFLPHLRPTYGAFVKQSRDPSIT